MWAGLKYKAGTKHALSGISRNLEKIVMYILFLVSQFSPFKSIDLINNC